MNFLQEQKNDNRLQLNLIHLDNSLKFQKNFISLAKENSANEIEALNLASHLRLWAKDNLLYYFSDFLKDHLVIDEKKLNVTFFGSGDFHHVTALILPFIIQKFRKNFTIIHFDNHPDWVKDKNRLHCGSWVNRAITLPEVDKVITIGVSSKDLNFPELKGANLRALEDNKVVLYPFYHDPSFVFSNYKINESFEQKGKKLFWKNIGKIDFNDLFLKIKKQIKTDSIYITFDKDVLLKQDAETNWDQGQMSLETIINIIKLLSENYKIFGIDVTGDYSKPIYTGDFFTTFMKRAEILIDQDLKVKNIENLSVINDRANQKLLNFFKQISF
jgi:hypothetical protein